ncbi:SACS protein, partial [Amia calva]|nr:SACS protein [Amia calva]
PRLPRVTVLHEYIGHRVFEVSPSAAVKDIKQLIYAETDFPVLEQQLLHNGKELHDGVCIGNLLHPGSCEIFTTLQGRGLKGGGRFGQTTPPLVEFLKDILRRYPEGGQILKELIQNAEDAGATEVKFMYDETEYGRESLWSDDMGQYQGSALYAYNNAVFTMEDWNGIQEIARSRKREDPLKVGRFGIGFNSVYHITDVPSIFSGEQIGMLDPHQTLFGPHESGQCWNLKTEMKEITEHADQFAPYVGLFGSSEKTIKDGSFPGTLFRFPLRVKPSQLSSNIYNKEKVLELFESFKADADTVLLFLKSVQVVSLYVRESDGTERMLFRVTAGENPEMKLERPNSLKSLGLAIDSYSNGVPSSSVTCATYQVNIETEDETAKETHKMSWLVCNSVGGRGMCNELDCLADDLKFIPTIGIAMPLMGMDEDQGAAAGFSGRAFCFLPLPPGEESMTGLPVHVSGFFGLTDNRRSIKWREVDQWRDPAALWNELLIVNVVPRAYSTLLLEAIKRIQTKKDQDFPLSAEGVYKAWPDISQIRARWKPILEPLLQHLLQQPVIYSMSKSWLKADEVHFSELDDGIDSTGTVISYLQSSGMQVAKVPATVADVLSSYIPESKAVKKVSPGVVRYVLRKFRHKGPSLEKLHLLEFVLSDACFSDLIGLELLPLQNEAFVAFSSSVSEKDAVYITSEDYPRTLFPGLSGRLLSESIKPSVLEVLKEAAKSRGRPCTQLQLLTPERSARLIKDILTTVWPSKDMAVQWNPGNQEKKHPTVSWLKMVWKYLYIHFPEDLSIFEDMPLIPNVLLEDNITSLELLRLRTPSPIILEHEEEAPLPEHLPEIIKKLGGIIIKCLDPSLQHPLLNKYIHQPSACSVLQIMDRSSTQKVASQVSSFPAKQKVALRGFLAGLPDIAEKERRILQELMIFEKIGPSPEKGTPAFTVLKSAKALHHSAKLPADIRLSINVIDNSDEAAIRLIKMLNVEQLKSTECLKFIIQDIEKGFYSKEEVIEIMLWVLKHLSFLKNENSAIIEWLSSLKFIQISPGKHVAVPELFDPELEILQNLFYTDEKTRFPPSTFTSSPDILHSLRQLGLKNEVQLSEKDILQVARKIEELQSNTKTEWEPLLKKAKTLLTILCKQTKLVKSPEVQVSLQKLKWPYLYSLPKTMVKFNKLFQFCGSVEEVIPNHVLEVIMIIHERSEQALTKEESKQNLLLLLNILRWLYSSQISVDLDTPIPILYNKDPSKLVMKPIHECCYCDIKVDDLNDLLDDVSEPIILVHDDIPMKTAEWLKVPCLSTRLINPENLGFEQSGQREPLTVRIKNILEEYPSVSDIFKELLQNADDASATECSFLIDMRKNLDMRENLLDPGMSISHGPSLWSYNNSTFSDTDFVNITRLGGSMKRCEVDKVGKFGLGFNSVYHVTDIPIIMSREFMIMFDPNINHLSKHIRDKSNPGIKINWSKQQKRLRKFPNQFKPFINVFNCQLPLSKELPYKYNGTLFRLPFRTEQEASVSEISKVFCYLPLRIKTGLPVHINGCFAVTSNRKEIWKTDTKGRWNSVFMRHVIVQGYLEALSMLRVMAVNGELLNYNYYAVWPDPGVVHDDFALVSQGIYQEIAKGGDKDLAKVFSDGKTWVSIKHVRFLDDSLLCRPDIGPAAFKIFLKYLRKSGSQDLCAVELPYWVKEGFEDAGCKGMLMENTLTEKQFFSDVFFPHIQDIEKDLRDPLMQYVLNEKVEEFAAILRVTPCIPCSAKSQKLVVPSRLIHPEGRVAKLYDTNDGRFPHGTTADYLNPVCLVKLLQLGMVKDDISWDDLIERTESVAALNESDHAAACLRSSILLSLIDEKLKIRDTRADEFLIKLQNICFLPFLTKPAGFSLPWFGNNFPPSTMFSATDLYTTDHQDTVCLMKPILNENSPSFKGCGPITLAVKDFLGLIKKPAVELVISQLKELSRSFDGVTLYQENITNACYKYLHEEMLQNETANEQIMQELKNFSFILVENTYVEPAKVAFHLNFDSAPYLYQLPNKYRNSFRELFEKVGVQPSFTVANFAAVLESVKKECGRKQLSEENFQLCRRIISEGIWGLIRDKNLEFCQSRYGEILLPDSHLTLQPSKSLCYNDCPWIKVRDTTVKYCHADIPREVAVKLGAIPKRHKALERYASNICFTTLGSEFGQKEKLTSRIKSILNAYPSEKEMLKELLQNADDAKATEIYFVFDPRSHPTDRIFDDKWIPLQGPALCVFNNQPFTEDDIRGIQNLGRGTKEGNPGKTGQYGIGFNSVYHITDCPSFISNNDILCIFDPHAHYAPGATSVSPGRMFRDLDSDFRTQFSDVLNLYLGNHFKLDRCTMFRFPIRNVDMAKISDISNVPASDRMVQNLLDKLRADGAELLMFLNHMEKISICEVEKNTGDLKVLYSVTAKITDGDRLKRKQFHASVIDSVTKKKQLTQIPVQQITYTMDIEDSDGNLMTWLVCNRSGFSNIEKVSKSVISAHKNEDITLFPRGGVAACISHNYKKQHRAFCFLPLSLETGLPFHVNGHFALDSARRNLWRDDNGVGVRSDWNNNLMVALIAPAYVELLIQLKRRFFPGSDPTITVLQGTAIHIVKDTLRNLKLLVDYCFKDAEEDEIRIEGLPLLITMDNILQVFDSKRPKFLTTHHDLIPSRKELFMNTLYMKYSNILMKSGVAKVFDISSFGDLLGSVLPREYRTRTLVKWKDNYASESWLKNVWHFISDNICVKEEQSDIKPKFETVLDILKDWALLPGIKFMVSSNKLVVPECDILLPLSLIYAAIFPNGQNDKVFHTLMKGGCIQLALNKICPKENHVVQLLAQHTANIDNPSSLLKALEYMIQTSAFNTGSLIDNDFEALLLYFNCNLTSLSQEDVQSLKLLPCYKSVSGRYINISKFGSCYVLTKSIPSADMEKWAQSTSSAFLVDNPQLKELYSFLGCVPVDDLEVYLKHLLPKFDSLSYDAKIEHLMYLKDRLLSMEDSSGIKDQLYEKLESLSFIYDSTKRLRPAKNFFDRTVKVFEVMLPEKAFISNDFFKKIEQASKPKNGTSFLTSWIEFLRNIGLKYIISQQQVLQFAKEVSIKSQTENWSKEKVQFIVDVLLNHIFNERTDLFLGTFLKELSTIPFLCPERAPVELVRLHVQHQEMNGTLPLIRFNGSQVNPKFKQTDVMQLLWTSCPILPEKATPDSIKEQEGNSLSAQEQLDLVLTMLNVNMDPPLDKVISNCKNICNIVNPDDDMVKTRVKVLRSTYEFLSADKRDFRYQLRGVGFLMVEDGWKLLKPEEVVINLDNESDFKPYLYKLPLELGTFHQLFKLLGTEDIVSTKQYIEVLCRIFRNSEGKQLDPNEMRTVKRAVSGLFKSLQNDPVQIRQDLDNLRDLTFYLPSHDGRLAKSNTLVFDDAPHYKSRIQGNIGVQMLVDLSQCYLGKDHAFHTKLIMLLPQKLRPRLLSSILEEQLDEETPKMCQFGALCSLQGRLQLLLSSEQFITGLIRIMKHENDNAFLVNEEKAIRLCKALCEGLKVSCFEKLQTTLRVKGFSPIPHSRSETLAFLKRYGTAVIHLYIQHSDSKDINFLLALAMTLKSATDNLISDTSYLIAMLGCNDIYRITEKLDNLGVKYDSTEPSKLELLLMDPMNVFYPGEYVGYLVDSEGGDIYGSYQPTYTYAIIVQEVEKEEEENPSFLGKYFQIDIGYSEYKIVSSLDLYKFSRQDDSSHIRDSAPSTPTSPSECPSPGPRMVPPLFPGKESLRAPPSKQSPQKLRASALPEILKEVTLVIEQAWRLPESERKKIIRRLYLKWHPDKNADNLDIATEVFKHLQNEINRMEKQGQADQAADRAARRPFSASSTRFQSEKFSFQRFYTSWNQEATSHKSERQQFREQFTGYAGSSHSPRFFVPPTFKSVGNPVEARRWLRQARANFSAARNDLHKNANEWVCFKCYLATKLALIAADYAVRGKSDKDVKPTALAQKVEEYNEQLAGLASDVHILEAYGVDSLRTRYPDLLPFPQIPNDRYTSEVAMRVMECTARVIIKLEGFIQQKI